MEPYPDRCPTLAFASAVRPLHAAPVPYPLPASLGAEIPPKTPLPQLILLFGIPSAAWTGAVCSVCPEEKQIYG